MYQGYLNYINNINVNDILNINFKSNKNYNGILEHVSYEQGEKYLKLIENEFTNIKQDDVIFFVKRNDKYGCPNIDNFTCRDGTIISCSPTSLRYVYHSLIILEHYKNTNLNSIVEIGCGYGGLFLAICYFSKLLNIKVDNYYMIDFPEVCNLIDNYLKVNGDFVNINYSLHSCHEYGKNITERDLFLISNYCFTEISDENRKNYINNLFEKVKNGFFVWQTCLGINIDDVKIISKLIKNIIVEKPQTAPLDKPNYFVYF
jgi:hypothetical protein